MPPKEIKMKAEVGRKKQIRDRKKTYKQETCDEDKERMSNRPTQWRERLLHILRTPATYGKEIHGIKVPKLIFEQLTSQEIRDLRFVFEKFDVNSDGYLDDLEVWHALKTLSFHVSNVEATQAVFDVSIGQRRRVSFREFLEIVLDRQRDARDTHYEILKVFRMFDLESKGSISRENLLQVCRQAQVTLTEQEVDGMIQEADVNGDRCIDQTEFIRIMMQTNLF